MSDCASIPTFQLCTQPSDLIANPMYYYFFVWDTSGLRPSPPHLSHYSFGALSKIILLFSEEFFTCKLLC